MMLILPLLPWSLYYLTRFHESMDMHISFYAICIHVLMYLMYREVVYVASASRPFMAYNIRDGSRIRTYDDVKPSYPYSTIVYSGLATVLLVVQPIILKP